jgi:hypothetical protein
MRQGWGYGLGDGKSERREQDLEKANNGNQPGEGAPGPESLTLGEAGKPGDDPEAAVVHPAEEESAITNRQVDLEGMDAEAILAGH